MENHDYCQTQIANKKAAGAKRSCSAKKLDPAEISCALVIGSSRADRQDRVWRKSEGWERDAASWKISGNDYALVSRRGICYKP